MFTSAHALQKGSWGNKHIVCPDKSLREKETWVRTSPAVELSLFNYMEYLVKKKKKEKR